MTCVYHLGGLEYSLSYATCPMIRGRDSCLNASLPSRDSPCHCPTQSYPLQTSWIR